MTQVNPSDWWQREKQTRLLRVLLFLLVLLLLIAFFYYINSQGRIGIVNGVDFDTANYIAFVRQEDDGSFGLYAIRADGSDNIRHLTPSSDRSNKAHPSWTADGKALVYASNLKDGRTTQLYLLGSGGPRQLTYGTGNKFSPVVSPDGRLVLFITQGAVKTVTITGTDVTQVMPPPIHSNEGSDTDPSQGIEFAGPFLSAAFAPDSVGIAGIQDVSNENIAGDPKRPLYVDQQVAVIPLGAEQAKPLDRGHEVSIAWEPNGKRLACGYTEFPMMDTSGNLIDANGRPIVEKIKSGAQSQRQKGYPISGIRIWTFYGSNSRLLQKYEIKNLFAGVGYSIEPKNLAWSPDGTKMAFEGWRLKGEGERELVGIVVMDVPPIQDSGMTGARIDPQNVDKMVYMVSADKDGKPQNPRWSPDGMRLLYEKVRPDGRRDLWIINSDHTNPINLTKGKGDNMDAVWSPAK
jgi:dipeptidyl aminopeptidase/acylaminoacyl peptidase